MYLKSAFSLFIKPKMDMICIAIDKIIRGIEVGIPVEISCWYYDSDLNPVFDGKCNVLLGLMKKQIMK